MHMHELAVHVLVDVATKHSVANTYTYVHVRTRMFTNECTYAYFHELMSVTYA